MWWAGADRVDLYLGTRRVVLCRAGEILANEQVDGLPAATARAAEVLSESADRGSIRIWLSGGLCRPYLLPASASSVRRDERIKVATALAATRAGMSGDCEVMVEPGGKADAGLAVAVARETLASIRTALKGRRIQSIRPWWAAALEALLRQSQAPVAVGVRDCDALTVLAGARDAFGMALTHATDNPDVARLAWSRSVLNDAVPEGPQVLVGLQEERCDGAMAEMPLGTLAREEAP